MILFFSLSDYVEGLIQRGKFLWAIRVVLAVVATLLRIIPVSKVRQKIADGRIFVEYQSNRFTAAENIIYKFSRYQSPSVWAVTSYIARVVNMAYEMRLEEIVASKNLRPDLVPLLRSSLKRRDGDLKGALKELDYTSDSRVVRNKIAHARRGIFHQLRDHEALAEDGMRFLMEEPNELLIDFTVTVAASAEAAHRDDILCYALRRLFDDRERIASSTRLLRRKWKDAITVSLTLFDVGGAIKIAELAEKARVRSARARKSQLVDLENEISEWAEVVKRAHKYMHAKAFMLPISAPKVPVFVVPAAAFRRNKIDYPTFRSEIRFVLKSIALALSQEGVDFEVRGRIRTHGELSFDMPSFSYHTISDNKDALHFKETDRPSRFSFDTGGYAGWSSFASTTIEEMKLTEIDSDEALRFFRAEQDLIISGNVSKYAQLDRKIKETLPKSFVFVALQVPGDAVQALAYTTPFAMLEEVIDTCRLHDLKIVVKRHPQDKNAQLSRFLQRLESAGEVTVATGSIHNLIERSSAVCVLNSGVGAEALLHEKPVFVFGKADYMNACWVCREPGDFRRQFKVGLAKLPTEQLHRFWWVLRNEHSVSLANRNESAEWIRARIAKHVSETWEKKH